MTMHNRSRGLSGQMIYQLMLIMACVALAIAAFFPTLDFFQTYRGAVEGGGSSLRLGDTGTPSGAGRTPTTTPAPEEETTPETLPEETTDTDATSEGG